MRKVVIAFNGNRFSEGAFEFVRRMNCEQPIFLTGLFLPQTDYVMWSYTGPVAVPPYDRSTETDAVEVQENIDHFEALCQRNAIEYRVNKDFTDLTMAALIKETRFADVAVLGCETLYGNPGKNEHYDYLKEILHTAECPVVLVPEVFEYPASNIIAFDGSESSAFALKQFAYLFPESSRNKTLLVYTNEDEDEFPDEAFITELASMHFRDFTTLTLGINPDKYFATWISEQENAILVSGAFSKPYFARMFKKSFVAEVLKQHQLPLFIAHR